jgi:hypothetical protein
MKQKLPPDFTGIKFYNSSNNMCEIVSDVEGTALKPAHILGRTHRNNGTTFTWEQQKATFRTYVNQGSYKIISTPADEPEVIEI